MILREFGEVYDFEITQISAQDIDDVTVSSTKIRAALIKGDIKEANAFLGYHFMLTGVVVRGKSLGKQIGFPTANLNIEEVYKLIPKNGAYIVKSYIEGKVVYGMMNIGTNPTVNGERQSIEIHFFDFDKDIYNKKVEIQLLERLRDEQEFNAIATLQAQLFIDKKKSLDYIQHNYG